MTSRVEKVGDIMIEPVNMVPEIRVSLVLGVEEGSEEDIAAYIGQMVIEAVKAKQLQKRNLDAVSEREQQRQWQLAALHKELSENQQKSIALREGAEHLRMLIRKLQVKTR